MWSKGSAIADELEDLRRASLSTVLIGLTLSWYLWCAVLFLTHLQFGPWQWGLSLLASGIGLSYLVRKRSITAASLVLIFGVSATVTWAMWMGDNRIAPYLLTLVVGLGGLLLGPLAVTWIGCLCNGMLLLLGVLRWEQPLYSSILLSPLVVINTVGILFTLVLRNLYQALHWYVERAATAQRNELELRERQGQLARTIKALDEAHARLEHLSYDLARAREAAENAWLAKQRFVTQVSHELRTPLNVIIAFSEMMYLSPERYGMTRLPPSLRSDIREVYRSSQYLAQMIDDVLDMSQLEAGQTRLELEPTDFREVVNDALEIVRPLVPEHVHLNTEIPEDLPPVLIDRSRIQQVLVNLLNNARRFTREGQITISATREESNSFVRVTVADTGVGIPPSEHERLFQEFQQVGPHGRRSRSGTGLGLAISKRFVEAHGGRIWVESDGVPGHGSRFSFTIPTIEYHPVPASNLRYTRHQRRAPTRRGRAILVMSRDPYLLRMLDRNLEEYQVIPADDVVTVSRLSSEIHARSIILPFAWHRVSEVEFQELARIARNCALPIIVCPLIGPAELGREGNVKACLIKPVMREQLFAVLDQLDNHIRRILVVDDDPYMVRLLTRLLQTAPREYEVFQAYNGREGLQMAQKVRPDLMLLDIVMPDMDGYTVLAQMWESDELREIPVIIVTAHELTPEDERRLGGHWLGLFKGEGFSNRELLTYLKNLLDTMVPSATPRTRH